MNPYPLLLILSDGHFHSGPDIGVALGMTRSAVWKGVRVLGDAGLHIDSVRGKGYRLADRLPLLDEKEIMCRLEPVHAKRVSAIDVHYCVDSTNLTLGRLLENRSEIPVPGQARVCLAEMQTAGKGRRGRKWVSPLAGSLYFSLARCFQSGLSGLECLSLVTGIAVIRVLRSFGVEEAMLKWPNDILVRNQKLAGILLEMSSADMNEFRVVFGIGINLAPSDSQMEAVDQPWTCLQRHLPGVPDRNPLVAGLIRELQECIDQLETGGFASFRDEWSACDCISGKEVNVSLADGVVISGRARGLGESGSLVIETGSGLQEFTGGEVSVRMNTGVA